MFYLSNSPYSSEKNELVMDNSMYYKHNVKHKKPVTKQYMILVTEFSITGKANQFNSGQSND